MIRQEQCDKVCRILDDVLANRPTERDSLIVAVRKAFDAMPPAEPKRIRGKWVGADTQCGIACSVCGVAVDDFCHSADYIDLDYEPNFCPNCGANIAPMSGKSSW